MSSPKPRSQIGEPVRLPGVGTRVDFVDEHGERFCVVNRDDGTVELYLPKDAGEPTTIRLSDAVARSLGALLAGHYELAPTLAARTDRVLGGLAFDWVHVPPGGRVVGRSIAEMEVRERTGATIVALLRGSVPIVAPDPAARFESGDDVIVVCRPADLSQARAYLAAR